MNKNSQWLNLPNRLTLLRIIMVPVMVGVFYIGAPVGDVLATIIFIAAAITDLLDGYIARSRHLVTNFGKFIDPIADKLLVNSAMILLVAVGRLPAWACIIFVGRELIVSGFRLVAASKGEVMAAGVLGKLKTFFQTCMVAVMLLSNFPFSKIGFPMDTILMWISLVFTIWSMVTYMSANWHVLENQ